jgi:heptose I phosphotransferase
LDYWTATEPLRSAIGESDPLDWLDAQEGDAFRHKDGRRTFRFELDGRRYFAKVQSGVGLIEAVKELASLRTPPLDARREVRALERLGEAGVPAPKLAGWGVRSKGPLHRRSFIITQDVGTQRTVDDLARKQGTNAWGDRRRLIGEVAELVGAMHSAGVNHRDLYFGHILVTEEQDAARQLVLIDLHRAQVWKEVPERWLAKDLGTLGFAALPYGLSRAERLRFLLAYTGDRNRARELWCSPVGLSAAARIGRIEAERVRKGDDFGG